MGKRQTSHAVYVLRNNEVHSCNHCCSYVEIKCQLDATDDIYCRFYCMLNMFFWQYYTHHQELESIVQMVAACVIWCFGFQVVGIVWS